MNTKHYGHRASSFIYIIIIIWFSIYFYRSMNCTHQLLFGNIDKVYPNMLYSNTNTFDLNGLKMRRKLEISIENKKKKLMYNWVILFGHWALGRFEILWDLLQNKFDLIFKRHSKVAKTKRRIFLYAFVFFAFERINIWHVVAFS